MTIALLTDEQRTLQAEARELAQSVFAGRAAEVDRTEEYPWESVALLRDAGLMGMTIPACYGGRGLHSFDAILAIEEIARACSTMGRITVEANMGAIGAIMAYGTEEQRHLAAALVLAGDKPAICITEPEVGSAATEMTTRAERHGDQYVINGKKHWITGGGVSRLYLIFARIFEDGVEQGIGGFIAVAGETPGLVIGRRERALGVRGIPETEVCFTDLMVPATMLLSAPGGPRRGFAALMSAYNAQRLGAATVALGIAARAHELAVERVKERRQFGRPIAEFQGLQWLLADDDIAISAARSLIHQAARNAGDGFPDLTETARAKVFAAEMAIKVTNDALQLFGATGYSRDWPLERLVRDARMFTIAGGTAQILRTQIASTVLGRKLPQTRDGYRDET